MGEFSINTYSPDNVDLIIGGYKVFGWDRISIQRNVQGYTPYVGIRNKSTRTRNTNTSATLSLSIIQTCPVNDVLANVHALDLQYGTGRLVITLKDNSGRSIFSTVDGYITAYPAAEYTSEIEYRVWNIYCQTTATWVYGGNTKPQTKLFDNIVDKVSGLF
jgi:hypothetical protein